MRLRTAPVISLFFKGIAPLIFHHFSFTVLAVARLSSSAFCVCLFDWRSLQRAIDASMCCCRSTCIFTVSCSQQNYSFLILLVADSLMALLSWWGCYDLMLWEMGEKLLRKFLQGVFSLWFWVVVVSSSQKNEMSCFYWTFCFKCTETSTAKSVVLILCSIV